MLERSTRKTALALAVLVLLAAARLAAAADDVQAQSSVAWPLKASENQRYLVDQSGRPFFISGDSPWDIFQNVELTDACKYLDDRKQRGFNTLLVTLVADTSKLKRDRWGRWPFKEGREFREPNKAYWRHVDEVMVELNKRGFFVVACPTWVDVWSKELRDEAMKEYGPFLARRYGKYQNLAWILGGDTNPGRGNEQGTRWLAEILRREVPHQLISYHCAPGSPSAKYFRKDGWLTLNSAYMYNLAYPQVRDEWRNTDRVLPVYLCETGYEGEGNGGHNWNAREVRKQHYWALTSGACGHVHGSAVLWWFGNGWQDWIDKPATRQMAHIRSLFVPRTWWKLRPDIDNSFLTSGAGGYGSWEYATAAVADDKSWAIAYVPTAREITLEMSKLSDKAKARWYDPTSGQFQAAASASKPNSTARVFTSPAKNTAGDGDFALILEKP